MPWQQKMLACLVLKSELQKTCITTFWKKKKIKMADSKKLRFSKFHRLVLDWFELFGCFWAYVGQPHGHIGWATSMPFASINLTKVTQGPICEIFAKFFWELVVLNISVLLSRPFWIFFSRFFFCFIPIKISTNSYGTMDGSEFWCFPWFPENSLLCVIWCYTVYLCILTSHWHVKGVNCLLY